jgi:hypothetical protein
LGMFTLSVAAMNRRVKAVDADFKNHAYIRFGYFYIENINSYKVYFVITLSYNLYTYPVIKRLVVIGNSSPNIVMEILLLLLLLCIKPPNIISMQGLKQFNDYFFMEIKSLRRKHFMKISVLVNNIN